MSEGYFPAGKSMLRQVMQERCVGLMYGQRALCIGALKPLNYVGTVEHSHQLETPFKRLSRTATMFEHVYFGTREEADATLASVASMHTRVHGELPHDAGPHHPAGTPYDAMDPSLMLWTVANLADSSAWFYEHLVQPMGPAQAEAFWQDWLRFGELFGLAREHAPQTYTAFRLWFSEQLAGNDLFLTDEARYMGYMTAFGIPMPASRQPFKHVHDAVMMYSLPGRVRELYGVRLSASQRTAAQLTIAAQRRLRTVTPAALATGSCIPSFRAVAHTERERIASGQWTPRPSDHLERGHLPSLSHRRSATSRHA
jgi:uncharacterized protein (DUF2236 family)